MLTPSKDCEICAFKNPKATVTAVIIKDNKLLMFQTEDGLDMPGGFVDEGETPEQALRREIKEELGMEIKQMDQIGFFPGTYRYNGHEIPVLAIAYLVELDETQGVKPSEVPTIWFDYIEKDPAQMFIVHETDLKVVQHVKDNFSYPIERVKELLAQLDSSAVVKEINLYRSIIQGLFVPMFEAPVEKPNQTKLIGMGWIYPRQTVLRNQGVVEDMIVDESKRGQGRGEIILTGLMELAKRRGVEVLELTSGYHREAAHRLYKKVGFRIHETAHMLKDL